jgi:hypothetical protein
MKIKVGDISVKIDGDNIYLKQNDQITGFLHWITITKDEFNQIKEFINNENSN